MARVKFFLIGLLLAAASFTQSGTSPPEYPGASLPTCNDNYEQQVRIFQFGNAADDCTTGGGSTKVRCRCESGTWTYDVGGGVASPATVIVDAAGGGDYTSVATACAATSALGSIIKVFPGDYSEGDLTVQSGTHVECVPGEAYNSNQVANISESGGFSGDSWMTLGSDATIRGCNLTGTKSVSGDKNLVELGTRAEILDSSLILSSSNNGTLRGIETNASSVVRGVRINMTMGVSGDVAGVYAAGNGARISDTTMFCSGLSTCEFGIQAVLGVTENVYTDVVMSGTQGYGTGLDSTGAVTVKVAGGVIPSVGANVTVHNAAEAKVYEGGINTTAFNWFTDSGDRLLAIGEKPSGEQYIALADQLTDWSYVQFGSNSYGAAFYNYSYSYMNGSTVFQNNDGSREDMRVGLGSPGVVINDGSNAVSDFLVRGDTELTLLQCDVSLDVCNYKGSEISTSGGGGTPTRIEDVDQDTWTDAEFTSDVDIVRFGTPGATSPLGIATTSTTFQMISAVSSAGPGFTSQTPTATTPVLRIQKDDVGTGVGGKGVSTDDYVSLIADSREIIRASDGTDTAGSAVLAASRDGTDAKVTVACNATNTGNCFEVDPDRDGDLTDASVYIQSDATMSFYPDGSCSAPNLEAGSDAGTGFYVGNNAVGACSSTGTVWSASNSIFTFAKDFRSSNGSGPHIDSSPMSLTDPGYAHYSDTDTGLGLDGSDAGALIAGGQTALEFTETGGTDVYIETHGGVRRSFVTLSANTTLDAGHHVVRVDTDAVTITLPACSSDGTEYRIKNVAGGGTTVTVDGNASETIDGATTVTLNDDDAIDVICTGSGAWDVF